jgi:hypothetical protein
LKKAHSRFVADERHLAKSPRRGILAAPMKTSKAALRLLLLTLVAAMSFGCVTETINDDDLPPPPPPKKPHPSIFNPFNWFAPPRRQQPQQPVIEQSFVEPNSTGQSQTTTQVLQ